MLTAASLACLVPTLSRAYLSRVVEAFGFDIIALLIHHLHLGMELSA